MVKLVVIYTFFMASGGAVEPEPFQPTEKGRPVRSMAVFRPDMTVTRARIMKENYDQRRYLENLVNRGDEAYGLGMKALAFGASLVGSLPDPVNFIPFAGGLKAASVGRGMAKGALEGAAGNALVDALVLPDLAAKGEDVGFADALLDTAFGALLGGALGGLGGALGGYAGKRFEARKGSDTLPRNEDADMLRASLGAGDRDAVTRAMEKALADVHADRPVDVSDVLRESETLGKAYDAVRRDPLGGPADEVLASIQPNDIEAVLVHRGPAVMRDGEIVVQGAHLKRAGLAKRGFGLVKIIFAHGEEGNKTPTMPPVTRGDIIGLPHTLRDYLPAETEGTTTVWRIPREDGNHLNIVVGGGQDKDATRLVTMFVDDKNTRLSQKKNRPSSLTLPGERTQDTSQGISVFTPDGSDGKNQLAGDVNISPDRPVVNYATERPDAFTPAPALQEENPSLPRPMHEEMGLDPATGLLPEESLVNEMDAAGRVAPEDRDALLTAQQEAARAPEYDDIGQSIIPCILEVSDGK